MYVHLPIKVIFLRCRKIYVEINDVIIPQKNVDLLISSEFISMWHISSISKYLEKGTEYNLSNVFDPPAIIAYKTKWRRKKKLNGNIGRHGGQSIRLHRIFYK